MLSLQPGEAHIWYVFPEEITDPYLIAAYHMLMAPDEAVQQARFKFPEGRHEYLVTRALVRSVLSAYANVAPRDWRFVRNRYGRPEIAGPSGVPPLRFNLSNTRGLIACLVTLEREVGVDVEDTSRKGETVGVADRFFSPSESAALRALPEARQRHRFFDYWTLKEAYIKARGMGLAIPLEHFSFYLDEPAGIRIRFTPDLPDDPEAWQFCLWSPTARHRMAAALRKGRGAAPLAIALKPCVPLDTVP
jgi:4'-phosphopantetheinyl transferase